MVVVCSIKAPDDALMMTVYIWETGGGEVGTLDEPPHPELNTTPAKTIRTRILAGICFFHPMKHSNPAKAVARITGPPLRCSAALDGGVATVSVVWALVPDGVTVWGEKLQEAPEGNPVHAKETAELNP